MSNHLLRRQLPIFRRIRILLYGLETMKQVLEQGVHWDRLFSALLAMDLQYRKDVTKHFKNLKENHRFLEESKTNAGVFQISIRFGLSLLLGLKKNVTI